LKELDRVMDLKDRIKTLNDLIAKGNTVEAMEIFYSDGVTMQENEDEPRVGKAHCIAHEKKILIGMKSNSSKLLRQAMDAEKGIVFGEWQHFFRTKDDKELLLTEISVQHWKDGLITEEKFYYKEMKRVGK